MQTTVAVIYTIHVYTSIIIFSLQCAIVFYSSLVRVLSLKMVKVQYIKHYCNQICLQIIWTFIIKIIFLSLLFLTNVTIPYIVTTALLQLYLVRLQSFNVLAQLTITNKMVACIFYQNTLRVKQVKHWFAISPQYGK